MADLTFRNIINGESVDSLSGQTYDVLDPTTGEVYAQAPMSGAEDVDRAYAAADAAFDAWGETTPKDARPRAAEDRRRHRVAGRRDQRGRVPRHGQAARADDVGGDAVRLRPLPLLRRRLTRARGQVRGGVPGGPHLVDPPGAGRRGGSGDPVELPAADDDLEDRPRARRRQHRRPQAERHHPRELHPARRAVPGVPPARRPQRRVRRPRHRSSARRAQDAADGLHHRLGARRHGGRRLGRSRPQAGPPRARWQGAGDRLRRRRRREGRRGDRRRRLLQRRPGLHRRHPGACRTRRTRRLRRGDHRAGQEHEDRAARRRGRALRRAQQRRTS